MNLETGSIVGDYQIVGVLGAGGMGKVFNVRNTIFDRIEAMKVLLPDLAGEPELADRFLREIKVLASLDHPNIAALRTAVRFENQLLMIMELVEGVSLEQRIHQGRLGANDAAGYILQVLSALAYAHGRGVVHRDIKPANMMVTADGTVKLMDFGIAKSATDRKLTMTGSTLGSLYYMSPEQIQGDQSLDARSDLYSVGVSLYELVTGKRPFDGDSQFAIMAAHLQQNPAPPISLDPNLPQALNDLILLSVSRNRDARFQSAEAFHRALNGVMASLAPAPPVASQTLQLAPPLPEAQKSHRGLWVAAGALCCVGAMVAAIEFVPWKKTAASSPPPVARVVPPPDPVSPPVAPPVSPAPPPVQTAPASAPAPAPPVEPRPKHAALADRATRPATPSAPPSSPVAPPPSPAAAPTPAPPQPSAPPPQPVAPAAPQPDLAAHRAELQKVRESLVMLSARATSIHSTLDNLQRSQAASGLGLRSDWVHSASLMDSFLRGAGDALNAGDAPAARDLMDKSERQVEKLEKALNK